MTGIGKQGSGIGDDAKERLNCHEAEIERRAEREREAEIFWRMCVRMRTVRMIVHVDDCTLAC